MPDDLIVPTDLGLCCEAGCFYVDPWRPVERAVITHAHSDHARAGSQRYLCAAPGETVLRRRIGNDSHIQAIAYGENITINGVKVSLHPAGHLLGSAQVRVEHADQVCVVSGDYKPEPPGGDVTCEPFEPIACDHFISESTFGLPIYRWPRPTEVFNQINTWWRDNAALGRTSVIAAYALGKAQRVASGLDPSIGPIAAHGAALPFMDLYREQGVPLPEVLPVNKETLPAIKGRGLVIAPPSALGTPWMRKLGDSSSAMASGWMMVRGRRRHRSLDRGFVLSDHADWPGLLDSIAATGAARVGLTHGYTEPLGRFLREERGIDAYTIATRFVGEQEEEPDAQTSEAESQTTSAGAGA